MTPTDKSLMGGPLERNEKWTCECGMELTMTPPGDDGALGIKAFEPGTPSGAKLRHGTFRLIAGMWHHDHEDAGGLTKMNREGGDPLISVTVEKTHGD